MRSYEGLLVGIMTVLSLSIVSSTCRSLPQWSGGTDGLMSEGDPDLSPKDLPYWPTVLGQAPPTWVLPLSPRQARAENFIRFGRTHSDKRLANKKNNFIRLGRENPRQNNFIRLGRGGGGGIGQEELAWKWATDGIRDPSADYSSPNI